MSEETKDKTPFSLPATNATNDTEQANGTEQAGNTDPIADQEWQLYEPIRQGQGTNTLTKLRAVKGYNTIVDAITGDATIEAEDFEMKIYGYDHLAGLKTSTHQLLDCLVLLLTNEGARSKSVLLSVDNYMKMRGLKSRQKAREQLVEDLEVLLRTHVNWLEKRNGKKIPIGGMNVTDSWSWANPKHTAVIYTFGEKMFFTLCGYPVMPFHKGLLDIDNHKHPNGYYLGRKILEHKNMNAGKKNEFIISVATLLEHAPFLPSRAEVMAGNRNYAERIIAPFERDLDALADAIGMGWEYCHRNGAPLSQAEISSFDYDIFSASLVCFSLAGYPDQADRLKRRAEKQIEAKKKRARKK